MSRRNRRLSRRRRRELAEAAKAAAAAAAFPEYPEKKEDTTDMSYIPPPHMASFLIKDAESLMPGTLTDNYWLHLQVRKTKEFVKNPFTHADTMIYKGEMFNEIMRSADSDWPYVGEDFDVRSNVATVERRYGGRCNVTPAFWKTPSVWFWALPELAAQLGMELQILCAEKV